MADVYRPVQWNRFKKRFDLLLAIGVAVFVVLFLSATVSTHPDVTEEIAMMRATAVTAFLLLHVILAIGPLTRLDRRFLPLLYNRRHLGVTMFLVATFHSLLATLTYHFGSDVSPILGLLRGEDGEGMAAFPFQTFGFVAWVGLFLMAATSHDFWLRWLTAPMWKLLHQSVYVSYGLLVVHVAFGALQSEASVLSVSLLGLGVLTLSTLHLVAGMKERGRDVEASPVDDGFVEFCGVDDIPIDGARTRCVSGERVAVFRYDGKLSAVSSVCQHQNGPLGEGKVVDGCITCPWHGYQYRPESGRSPEPFTERIPTFRLRVLDGRVEVDPRPLEAGTNVEPWVLEEVRS